MSPRAVLLLCSLVLAASGCTPAAPAAAPPIPVTVQLSWTHSSEYAGLYAAEQMGYYAAQGLAVRMLEGPQGVDRIAAVADGRADFGVLNPNDMLVARAGGTPLTAVATVYRTSPMVFASLAGSGITRPQDFAGKTVETTASGRPVLDAMAARVGLDPSEYTVVDAAPSTQRFYAGEVNVRNLFVTNEVVSARASGRDLHLIYPGDYGVHFYADTILATDSLINGKPDLVLRFLRATLKGWTYAVENPLTIGPMVVKYRAAADPQVESTKMIASLPLVDTGEDTIGWMRDEVWANMTQLLWRNGSLARPLEPSEVYTMRFLREIYGR